MRRQWQTVGTSRKSETVLSDNVYFAISDCNKHPRLLEASRLIAIVTLWLGLSDLYIANEKAAQEVAAGKKQLAATISAAVTSWPWIACGPRAEKDPVEPPEPGSPNPDPESSAQPESC